MLRLQGKQLIWTQGKTLFLGDATFIGHQYDATGLAPVRASFVQWVKPAWKKAESGEKDGILTLLLDSSHIWNTFQRTLSYMIKVKIYLLLKTNWFLLLAAKSILITKTNHSFISFSLWLQNTFQCTSPIYRFWQHLALSYPYPAHCHSTWALPDYIAHLAINHG